MFTSLEDSVARAAVPPPFDTVIQVEQSQTGTDGFVRFTEKVRAGQNIAPEGDDASKGEVLIPAGTVLFPRHVATLAAVGQWEIPASLSISEGVRREPSSSACPGTRWR